MMIIYGGYAMEWDTEYLIPGMVLKNDLLQENGQDTAPLIPAGRVITVEDIVRLKRHKIEKIEIEEYDETFFELFRDFAAAAIKSYNIGSISRVAAIYEYIAKRDPDFKFDMTRYLDEELELSKHDVNVANMAVALTTKYNATVAVDDRIPIKDIAEIALLSDIGRRAKFSNVLELMKQKYGHMLDKFQKIYPNIPNDVFEYYHKNLQQFYGYLILKGSTLSNTQLTALLLHNEKEIGKFGPLGVEMGKQNSKLQSVQMAKILKVCNLYDILLYRAREENPEQPFGKINEEMDRMVASGITDPYWTKLIKLVVPVYPLGERVELSDGTIGVVSGYNEYDMSKPYISDLNGNAVDLYKEQLVIVGLCNEPKMSAPNMTMSASG